MYSTFAMEVKISARKKSGNEIGCMKKRTSICEPDYMLNQPSEKQQKNW